MLTLLLLSFLLGVVALLAVPLLGWGLGGRLRRLGDAYLTLAAATIGRNAVVVNDQGDTVWKRSSIDGDTGADTITLDGVARVFSDPAGAIHSLAGFPFTFADERRGVFFDLRHAAGGERMRDLDAEGRLRHEVVSAADGEIDVQQYVRGFLDLPRGATLPVALDGVRALVGGDEDSAACDRVDESAEKMFADQNTRTPFTRLLIPFGAAVGAWLLVWALATNAGGGGGSGSSISIGPISGSAALLLSLTRPSLSDRTRRVLRLVALGGGAVVVGGGALLAGGALLGNAMPWVVLAGAAGVVLPPLAAFLLGQMTAAVAEPAARLWARLGFGCYRKPVIHLEADDQYHVREADALDVTGEIEWYTLAKQRVGMAVDATTESWSRSGQTAADVQAHVPAALPDGGEALPHGSVPATDYVRDGIRAFVPEQPDPDRLYVRVDRFGAPWSGARTFQTGHKKMKKSIQEYGGGVGGLSDRLLLAVAVALFIVNVALAGWFFT